MVDGLLSFIRSVVHEASLSNEGRRPKLDWSKIDWTQSTSVIAQQTGIAQPTVSQQRRKHAPDTIGRDFTGKTAKRTFHDWSKVDWSKPTSVIAHELGVNQSHVSKARMMHAPKTMGQNSKTAPKGVDWSSIDWSKRTAAIAHELGVSTSTVTIQRHRYAPETIGKKTRLLITVSKGTKDTLKAKALEQGVSVDDLIEKLVNGWLEKQEPQRFK